MPVKGRVGNVCVGTWRRHRVDGGCKAIRQSGEGLQKTVREGLRVKLGDLGDLGQIRSGQCGVTLRCIIPTKAA